MRTEYRNYLVVKLHSVVCLGSDLKDGNLIVPTSLNIVLTWCLTFFKREMASAPDTKKTHKCIFCSKMIPMMKKPRRTPCGHFGCEKCLTYLMEVEKLPECNICEAKFPTDMVPSELSLDFGDEYSCDPCGSKGTGSEAVLYCRECNRRVCETHVEVSQLNFQTKPEKLVTLLNYSHLVQSLCYAVVKET